MKTFQWINEQWSQVSPFRARFKPFWITFKVKKFFSLKLKNKSNFSAFQYFCLDLLARFSFNSLWQYYLMFLRQCRIVSQSDSNFFCYFLFVIYIELIKVPRISSFAERLKFYLPNNEKQNVVLCWRWSTISKDIVKFWWKIHFLRNG